MKIKFNEVSFFNDLSSDIEVLRDYRGLPILYNKNGLSIGKLVGLTIYEDNDGKIKDIINDDEVYLDAKSLNKTIIFVPLEDISSVDTKHNYIAKNYKEEILIFNEYKDVVGALIDDTHMKYKGKVIELMINQDSL